MRWQRLLHEIIGPRALSNPSLQLPGGLPGQALCEMERECLVRFVSPLQMDTINAQRKQDCNSSRSSLMSLPTCPLCLDKSFQILLPGHALVSYPGPGHAPSQQPVPPRPGHAPVDATLAYPALKKIRTLSIDVELTLMTLFGQRQSSTMPPLKCAYQPMATCYDGYQRSAGGC